MAGYSTIGPSRSYRAASSARCGRRRVRVDAVGHHHHPLRGEARPGQHAGPHELAGHHHQARPPQRAGDDVAQVRALDGSVGGPLLERLEVVQREHEGNPRSGAAPCPPAWWTRSAPAVRRASHVASAATRAGRDRPRSGRTSVGSAAAMSGWAATNGSSTRSRSSRSGGARSISPRRLATVDSSLPPTSSGTSQSRLTRDGGHGHRPAAAASRYTSTMADAVRSHVNDRGPLPGGGTEALAELGVGEQPPERGGDGVDVERVDEQRRLAGDLGRRGRGRGDDRGALGHRLQHGQAEALPEARVADGRGSGVQGIDVGAGQEPEPPGGRGRQVAPALGPGDHEVGVDRAEAVERLEQPGQVLPRLHRAREEHVGPLQAVEAAHALDRRRRGRRRRRAPTARPASGRPRCPAASQSARVVSDGQSTSAASSRTRSRNRLNTATPSRGEVVGLVEEVEVVDGGHPWRSRRRGHVGRGVDDVDRAGGPLDHGASQPLPRVVQRRRGASGSGRTGIGGAPCLRRRPTGASALTPTCSTPPSRGHRGDGVERGARGAAGHAGASTARG